MNKHIEAEGSELVLRDENDNIAIIPKRLRKVVLNHIKSNRQESIKAIIKKLPTMKNYAGDGSVITKLDPLNEIEFQKWYKKYAVLTGNSVNPDDPLHYYNYRGYWKDYGGTLPTERDGYHLPSEYKTAGHPNRYVQGKDTKKKYGDGGVVKTDDTTDVPINVNNPVQLAPVDIVADKLPTIKPLVTTEKSDNTYVIKPDLIENKEYTPQGIKTTKYLEKVKKLNHNNLEDYAKQIYHDTGELLSAPQKAVIYAATGKYETPSKSFGINNPYLGLGVDMVLDPLNAAFGLGAARKIVSSLGSTGKKVPKFVQNVFNQSDKITEFVSKTNTNLTLKSLEEQSPLRQTISKSGEINTENALKFILKNEGQAKYDLIRSGFPEKLPTSMKWNDFESLATNKLIPLKIELNPRSSSNYGINKLGYLAAKRSSYETSIKETKHQIALGINVKENTLQLNKLLKEYEQLPKENYTITFSNKEQLGRGSDIHGNPVETLGHVHLLIDKDNPRILMSTQIQSDFFQKESYVLTENRIEKSLESLKRMEKQQQESKLILHKMKTEGVQPTTGRTVHDYEIRQLEDIISKQENTIIMKKADMENFAQKHLLEKNHQLRYIQEIIDHAAKRGDIDSIRIPTIETAAKIQNFEKTEVNDRNWQLIYKELMDMLHGKINSTSQLSKMTKSFITTEGRTTLIQSDMLTPSPIDVITERLKLRGGFNLAERNKNIPYVKYVDSQYSESNMTILKKYRDMPKELKKLGIETKTVTDNKGNTWYEFDIPKAFKEGKGKIRAFGIAPPAVGAGYLQQQNKSKEK